MEIATVTPFQIAAVRQAGDDIAGYRHIITPTFMRHAYRHHGDPKREASRGNIAVTEEDFEYIPELLDMPDFMITGLVYKNEKRIVYGKYLQGTTLFIEQAQTKKKTLASVSFYKVNAVRTVDTVFETLERDRRYDTARAKKISGTGGNPHDAGDPDDARAAANPAQPTDT